ncbi:hypothetical protein T484DRAFT_1824705 [Baffinella frigidus]|nr:hypothetical protein T484DRAFT_1824705 [Cryptophyta sp. CCMP2293]
MRAKAEAERELNAKVVIEHGLRLRSAYAEHVQIKGVEPACTSYHGKRGVTVDYQWVSPEVQVLGVWEMLPVSLLERPHSMANGRPYAGLPSRSWGSDHMALASMLRIHR